MSTKEDFSKSGPYVTDPELGAEPSLRSLIFRYYNEHFGIEQSNELTDDYITKWINDRSKEQEGNNE